MGEKIAIVFDKNSCSQAFAVGEMDEILRLKGYETCFANADMTVTMVGCYKFIHDILGESPSLQPSLPTPQSYSVRKVVHSTHTSWYIIGSDDIGCMYGGIDFARKVDLHGFDALEEWDSQPYISERGIKFNIPLDARTPSYSDSGDSAQANIENMWDMDFWHGFLDGMARAKFNVLSLWSLHPFPSMVRVPAYPKVALDDVKRTTVPITADLEGRRMSTPETLANLETIKVMTIDEKIGFWWEVMEYAKSRGIDVYLFTWNTFVYGTEESGYGFTTDLTDAGTKDYFRKSVEALVNTYPLLKGIGITSGENMSRDEDVDETWLFDTYGQGINDALTADPNREFRLIHRVQYSNIAKAMNAFSGLNPRCRMDTSFKYSQAHMHSSARPGYIHAHDDAYLRDIGDHRTWLTVRDDDYYMFRGGADPGFAREYIKGMPHDKLAGFYMGPDGYTWGREYISRDPDAPNQLVIDKRWYSFAMWGSLAYNPELSDDDFIGLLRLRFPGVDARRLFEAWTLASRVIPLVNRFHNEGCQLDFQWYPEACTSNTGFHDVDRFIHTAPQWGEGIVGIPGYVEAVLNGREVEGTTPPDIARELLGVSSQALELLVGMDGAGDKELQQTIGDIRALATLGKYYSRKISGATNKHLAECSADLETKAGYIADAVADLEEAAAIWRDYAAQVDAIYKPQTLTRMIPNPKTHSHLPRHTDVKELQAAVDRDVELARGLAVEAE